MTEKSLSLPKTINITGCLTPFKNGQPSFIHLPNNSNFWVAIFTTKDKLEKSCVELGIKDFNIKEVSDGMDFVNSLIEVGVRIMLDPYIVESEGKTFWTEVKLE